MPRAASYLVVFLATPLLTTLLFGCATTSGKLEAGDGIYRESAADVANRAPNSMSLPLNDATSARTQADYHFAMAETYSLEGNAARATEEYKLTLVYDAESATVRIRLAAEYVKQGLVSEAMEQAKVALEKENDNTDAHLLLGGLYSALRMYDDALKEYRAVLVYDTANYEAPLFIGALLAEQKKYAEASKQFEQLAKDSNNPSAHIAWYYLGRVKLEENKEKNTARAEAAFQKSLSIKPGYPEATLALGQLFESTNRKVNEKNLYQSYQEKYGPSPTVAEELSRLYIEEKDYRRAFEQLSIIESNDPSDINVKAKMAFILIEQQKYPEAIVRLEDVLAIEPSSDKIRFYLGAVYEEIKDYKSAISHFQKVPVGSSYYTESVIHTAYLYKLNSDYNHAIATIEQGIKAKDDHPPFYALYASLLDDQKEYKKAAVMLDEAVKKFPENAQLYFFLGNMLDRIGDKEGMLSAMKKVLVLDKDHVQALNFLAYTYAESGKQLDEAEKMVRRALELQPGDAYIMDTLGWVLFKEGNVNDAIRTLEAAYKIQPNESVIAEHLGDAYYHQQMPEKAKRLYMRAAETESNVATVEKIRSKIAAVDRQVESLGVDQKTRQPASTNH
jgi:tetratricopeptide (TPR) repeat protein